MELTSGRILLKRLTPEDVTKTYVDWLYDKEVTQFLECRWGVFTEGHLKTYVKNMSESSENILFGIFLKEKKEHIGNIKIGKINYVHKFGDVGLLIGNRNMWGKGYGTEAIKLVTCHAFKEIKLNKLTAGIYANNVGSYKAFMKAGYEKVGILKKQMIYKGYYVDQIIVEKLNVLD